jgi:hypothetical protein
VFSVGRETATNTPPSGAHPNQEHTVTDTSSSTKAKARLMATDLGLSYVDALSRVRNGSELAIVFQSDEPSMLGDTISHGHGYALSISLTGHTNPSSRPASVHSIKGLAATYASARVGDVDISWKDLRYTDDLTAYVGMYPVSARTSGNFPTEAQGLPKITAATRHWINPHQSEANTAGYALAMHGPETPWQKLTWVPCDRADNDHNDTVDPTADGLHWANVHERFTNAGSVWIDAYLDTRHGGNLERPIPTFYRVTQSWANKNKAEHVNMTYAACLTQASAIMDQMGDKDGYRKFYDAINDGYSTITVRFTDNVPPEDNIRRILDADPRLGDMTTESEPSNKPDCLTIWVPMEIGTEVERLLTDAGYPVTIVNTSEGDIELNA